MTQESRHFKIGLFVVASIALTLGAVLWLGGGALFQRAIYLETYLDESVQGLEVGAPVKLRGVRLGTVDSIDLAEAVYRDQLSGAFAGMGFRTCVIEASAPEELTRARLAQREHEPHVVSDARLEDLDRLSARYEPPNELRPDQLIRIDSVAPEAQTLESTLSHLVDASLARA